MSAGLIEINAIIEDAGPYLKDFGEFDRFKIYCDNYFKENEKDICVDDN